jgi:hypothetical protein
VETAFFSVDLGKWFRGELAFHSGGDGLGILTNSFSFFDDRFEYATNEALRSFGRDLSDLRGASEAKNLAALKKLVAPEQ